MLEYGIVHQLAPEILHRGPMSHDDALEWVKEWLEDGGSPTSFVVVERDVSPWRAC